MQGRLTYTTVAAATALCAYGAFLWFVATVETANYVRTKGMEPPTSPESMAPPPRILWLFSDAVNLHAAGNAKANPAYVLRHMTPDAARDYVRTECPLVVEAYDLVKPMAYKADIFRYCALWKDGGVYVDDDLELRMSLSDERLDAPGALLLVSDKLEWAVAPPRVVVARMWNAFMIARTPGSPTLACALAHAASNIIARKTHISTLGLTGPRLLRNCLRESSDVGFVGYNKGRAQGAFTWDGSQLVTHHVVNRSTVEDYSKMQWYR
tara:strand:+ start:365 stop:1165 length:801 start_codon:yes stop_codon:yes gene_type:complete